MNIRTFVLATLLAASSAAAAPHAASYAQAQKLYDFQPDNAETRAYKHAWSDFNNLHHLDEKDGCWPMPGGPLVQILELDATGKVIGYWSDQKNRRSRCWRKSYFGVTFPAPPVAPFYMRLEMP